jgi:carboxyl-terminal processing protease
VGQIGIEFCEKILRPTSFKTVNALGEGDYFGGLPVDCAAPDDIAFAVGADDDPNLLAAMAMLETGCPVAAAPAGQFKSQDTIVIPREHQGGRPEREFGNAY